MGIEKLDDIRDTNEHIRLRNRISRQRPKKDGETNQDFMIRNNASRALEQFDGRDTVIKLRDEADKEYANDKANQRELERGMKKGGKVKARGVGCAQRGHGKAGK